MLWPIFSSRSLDWISWLEVKSSAFAMIKFGQVVVFRVKRTRFWLESKYVISPQLTQISRTILKDFKSIACDNISYTQKWICKARWIKSYEIKSEIRSEFKLRSVEQHESLENERHVIENDQYCTESLGRECILGLKLKNQRLPPHFAFFATVSLCNSLVKSDNLFIYKLLYKNKLNIYDVLEKVD